MSRSMTEQRGNHTGHASIPQGFQLLESVTGPASTNANGNGGRAIRPGVTSPDAPRGFDDDSLYTLAGTMITQSLLDLLHRNPEVRRMALEWFFDPETRAPSEIGPLTFGWICEVTGTEPSYLLRKLRTEVVERAEHRARRGKVSLATYMERLQPFLHPANGNGGHS